MRERDSIRVVHWGLGATGLAMAQLVGRRLGLISAGAIDTDPARVGRDLGDLIGHGQFLGINVNNDPMGVLTEARPEITLIATGSRVDEMGPQILQAMEAGSNVICLAEEMTYPWAARPDLADSLDELAHAHGVTVLGTGLDPGFVLDTLVIALTGCCWDVQRIRASRVSGTASHIGFEESIHLIADALGWNLDRVEPGQPAAGHGSAVGYVDGVARIILEHPPHPPQAAPDAAAVAPGDYINIEGEPGIRLVIQPEIDALKGASAIAVNMIPAVLMSGPGLKTMADMPIPRAVLGDLRELLNMPGPTIEEELARGWQLPDMDGNNPHGRRQGGSLWP